jgi:RNA-directed DNA polymerase
MAATCTQVGADAWTSDFFVKNHGLHRLRGTVRYPEAA